MNEACVKCHVELYHHSNDDCEDHLTEYTHEVEARENCPACEQLLMLHSDEDWRRCLTKLGET